MKRVVETTTEAEFLADALMICSLPQDFNKIEALVVYQGLGEIWRLEHALNFKKTFSNIWFLYSGPDELKSKWKHESMNGLIALGLDNNKTIIDQTAVNTKDQADWSYEQVVKNKIQSLAISASPHHILRAYLTTLKVFIKKELYIPLFPSPSLISPSAIIPETEVNAWSMVASEMERIKTYRDKGDVATHQELIDYLDWLWQQPIMRQA